MAATEFDFFNRAEYFTQIIRLADKAKRGDRIAVATMPFDTFDPLIADIMRALCKAAARGALVHLAVDAYTFLIRSRAMVPGPLWFHTSLPTHLHEPYKTWLNALEELKSNGGHYGITNTPAKPFSNPFAGRSHIKTAIFNDYILIGGCNLDDSTQVDIMTGWRDKKAADWVYDWVVQMVATGSTQQTFGGKDRELSLGSGLKLLIDAGVPGQSTIYDHAMRLIDEAQESIFFTCQFFPGGITARHLLQAYERGVAVRIIYNRPLAHSYLAPGHWLYNLREHLRLPRDFFVEQRTAKAPFLHAKVIATEKEAIIGSHNYVTQGVRLGTAEIALLGPDPAFAQAIVRKIAQHL